jgi:tight adherence protein C
MELVIALIAGAAVFLLILAFIPLRRIDPLRARLTQISTVGTGTAPTLREMELQVPLFDRTVKPLAARMAGIGQRLATPRRVDQTEEKLIQAGNPGRMSATDFLGLKVGLATVMGLVTFALIGVLGRSLGMGVLLAAVLMALGYILPEFWLGRRIKSRQHQILLSLPDTLDMLTISIRAGLGFDGALAKVVEKAHGPLSDEFRRALAEIRVGRARRDALRDMVERTQVPPLTTFVSAIIQAEQLGVPIARVLTIQSEQLRLERRQRAEELAAKAPIKMLLPLVGCIFPAMFVVILGPAVIAFLTAFGGGVPKP